MCHGQTLRLSVLDWSNYVQLPHLSFEILQQLKTDIDIIETMDPLKQGIWIL